jgi:predicted short-subunit dehydrogenase-like oxidoreductase (DUF2520 family)
VPPQPIVIVGAGRMGQGVATILAARGVPVRLATRNLRRRGLPAPFFAVDDPQGYRGARLILVATPDDVIWDMARRLGEMGVVHPGTVVLHLSGAFDRGVLKPLALTGAALGSFHPLQSLAVPSRAPELLPGAYVAIEGDRRALGAGRRLAAMLGMIPVRIPDGAKPAHHAAATMVAGYVTALYHAAIRVAIEAGIDGRAALKMYLPLLKGTVATLDLLPPTHALTGAIRRGDVKTVEANLKALKRADRELFRVLGLRALELARKAGLTPERAAAIERLLAGHRSG